MGSAGPLGHGRDRRSGVTIFEMLIVLVLLTAAASIGIPAYFDRPSVTLDNAAKLLAKDLREVQNRAALYGEPLEIRFDPKGRGYQATDAYGEPLISPYGAGEFRRHYPHDAVFRGVEISLVEAGEDGKASFDDMGRPIEPARVVLSYDGESRSVLMRARSGLLEIQGLAQPWTDYGM